MKNRVITAALLLAACGLAVAKLPAPDDATKAKAAETAARAAWQAKIDAYQTCKVQDRVAALYMKNAKAAGKDVRAATPVAAPAPAPSATAAASAATPAPAAVAPPAAAPAMAAAAGEAGTPVKFAPPTPCADPGPFAYNPPEQKPLESSGAHSPAGNATSPPSVKQPSAEMAPAKKP